MELKNNCHLKNKIIICLNKITRIFAAVFILVHLSFDFRGLFLRFHILEPLDRLSYEILFFKIQIKSYTFAK